MYLSLLEYIDVIKLIRKPEKLQCGFEGDFILNRWSV